MVRPLRRWRTISINRSRPSRELTSGARRNSKTILEKGDHFYGKIKAKKEVRVMDDLKKNEMDDCKDVEVTIQDLFEEYEGESIAEKVTLFEPVGREKW